MLSRSAGTGPFSLPIKELKDKKEVLPEIPGNSNRAIKRYHQLGVPSSEFYGSLIKSRMDTNRNFQTIYQNFKTKSQTGELYISKLTRWDGENGKETKQKQKHVSCHKEAWRSVTRLQAATWWEECFREKKLRSLNNYLGSLKKHRLWTASERKRRNIGTRL